MAKAAGCSYQNVRQAATGEQATMDRAMLKKIAKWAGVNELFMVDGLGPMLAGEQPLRAEERAATPWVTQMGDQFSPPQKDQTPIGVTAPYATKLRRAPVVAWARLGVELYTDNREIDAEVHLPVTESASDRCKWVVAQSDMLRFGIRRGFKILIEPVDSAEQCLDGDGDIYLFGLPNGTLFLGEFRWLASGGYEAIPDTGTALERDRHGLRVLAEHIATHKK